MPRIHLIFARAANGVIGRAGTLPWHLPEDLAHFRALTTGAPVIMGRKTWDSLPPRFRPLPGRRNMVVTHQPMWNETGAERSSSLHDALQKCEQAADVWIIGGAQLYAAAAPFAQVAEVTEIDRPFEGDAWAPALPADRWREVHRERQVSATGLPFSFVRYLQDAPAAPGPRAAGPVFPTTPGDR